MFEIGDEIYFKAHGDSLEALSEVYNTSRAIITDKLISDKFKAVYKVEATDIKGREKGYRGVPFWLPEFLIQK